MTYLAVAISSADTDKALAVLHEVAGQADLAEIRLDLMQSFDLPRLLAERSLPVIITCRPVREGGRWRGTEIERLDVLHQAATLGVEYVDIEWDVAFEADALNRSRTKVILSRHHFTGMPEDLPAQAEALWAAGADVVKVVGTAQSVANCLPVLDLLKGAGRPTIAVAMGDSGLTTRVLAFRYAHSFLSFAAPDPAIKPVPSHGARDATSSSTAPGQLRLSTMQDVYRVQSISADTRFIGLVQPRANSSPLVATGNAWLSKNALDVRLVPLEVGDRENIADALEMIEKRAPFAGYLSQESDGRGICARRHGWNRVGDFENVIDALHGLLEASPA